MKMKTKLARTWKLVSGSVTAWNNQNALEFTKLYAEQRRFVVRPLKGAAAVTEEAKQRARGEIPHPRMFVKLPDPFI